jgi:hypothetical protein
MELGMKMRTGKGMLNFKLVVGLAILLQDVLNRKRLLKQPTRSDNNSV